MALNAYISDVQGLLHDTGASFYPVSLITGWINDARQQVAKNTECIRVLPPNSAGVASFTGLVGGTGYSIAPTVTLSAPQLLGGVQATAHATVSGGAVNAVVLDIAGSGYVLPPTVTFGGPGSNAAATAVLSPAVFTVANQEVYSFAAFNTFVQQTAGVSGILALKQVAVFWGNVKPPLNFKPFTWFNAYRRSWPIFSNWPCEWSQYGQGQSGTFYLWPVPVQVLGMDLDCICVPIALATDSDPEAIPAPWTDAVKYYAAYRAYLYAQRYDDADRMMGYYAGAIGKDRASVMRSLTTTY